MKGTIIILLLALLSSCANYIIPLDSFQKQMSDKTIETRKEVKINNPLFFNDITYKANNIEYIKVLDKNGNDYSLRNSPSIEMRVTHKNGKKTIFYFDTVTLQNGIISGSRSRLVTGLVQDIPVDSITKIEVQDGRKDFKYK
jgi:hypothetical protein